MRILLSDDSGKSYKYVLVEEAPNNGHCEVTLPNVAIGTTRGHFGKLKGKGITTQIGRASCRERV